MGDEELYRELRPLLFAIAYRMVSSGSEAEDIVQEAFVRLEGARKAGTVIESPRAYLVTVTTRLAIDHLRSARVRRESYVGPWLPEPLLTEPDPEQVVATADSLSTAFLMLLETLSPVERAVFLLREVFGYGYEEIAAIVGKTEANCRQIFARARRHVDAGRPRFATSREEREELVEIFLAACERGDMDQLVRLLAENAAFYGDGGGKVAATPRPIFGRDQVVSLLRGLLSQARRRNLRFRRAEVNGQAGGLVVDPEGNVVNVVSFDVRAGVIATIWSVANPDKLRDLGRP
jgi:RNA polymerase sigma-70 factor (TIGR02957 family)